MKRNCNLELRLMTTPSACSYTDNDCDVRSYVQGEYESMSGEGSSTSNDELLTIFYKGRIANCQATEIQARSIIRLACREMEGKRGKSDPSSPSMNSPIYSPSVDHSMKRSLQRFLEKRKNRAQATSPYSITRNHPQ